MNCQELKEAAWDYHENLLSPARQAEYDAHVASCTECTAFMKVCAEVTCEGMLEFLDDYIDRTLEAERRAIFERHLAICPECIAYLDSYQKTRDLTGSLPDGKPDADVPADLLRAILASRDRR